MTEAKPIKKRLSKHERQQQIIDCAMEEFGKNGFSGARTKEIARKAGISETLIFQFFKTKKELYKESLKTLFNNAPIEIMESYARQKDDHGLFRAAAKAVFQGVEERPIIIRMIFFAALDNFKFKSKKEGFGPRMISYLSDYISMRVEEGAFRSVNPLLAAQMFIHSVFLSAADKVMDVGCEYSEYSAEEGVDAIVDIFLEGIRTCGSRRQIISRMILPF